MEQSFTDLDALVREEKRLTAVENHSEAWAEGLSAGIEPEIIAEAALTTALAELLRDQRRAGCALADRAHARPGRRRGIRAGSVAALTPASGRSLIERSGAGFERATPEKDDAVHDTAAETAHGFRPAGARLACGVMPLRAGVILATSRPAAALSEIGREELPPPSTAPTPPGEAPGILIPGDTVPPPDPLQPSPPAAADPEESRRQARRTERHRPAGDRRERPAARNRLQPRPASGAGQAHARPDRRSRQERRHRKAAPAASGSATT